MEPRKALAEAVSCESVRVLDVSDPAVRGPFGTLTGSLAFCRTRPVTCFTSRMQTESGSCHTSKWYAVMSATRRTRYRTSRTAISGSDEILSRL